MKLTNKRILTLNKTNQMRIKAQSADEQVIEEVGVGSIVQKYRSAISGRKRWVALRLFNSDVGLVGYYGLSEDEKKEVDLLVGMARESL